MKRSVLLGSLALSVIFLVGGCGVSQRAIDDAQGRINALKTKGVPDSSLSDAVKYLYGATYAKEKDDKTLARKSLDSARILIAQSEAQYSENAARLKPYSDSVIGVLTNAKSKFTGMQLKALDSALAVIDGFVQKNWIYQIEDNCNKAVALLPTLKFNEDRAKELKERLPGVWVCTNTTKSDADKAVHAVETKTFTFGKDGKVTLVETKKARALRTSRKTGSSTRSAPGTAAATPSISLWTVSPASARTSRPFSKKTTRRRGKRSPKRPTIPSSPTTARTGGCPSAERAEWRRISSSRRSSDNKFFRISFISLICKGALCKESAFFICNCYFQ